MPNRIIKESIHESEKINALSDFEFRLWVNLLVYVDDYGRGDARPAVIKGNCFPLRDRIRISDIDAALKHLADTGVVSLYTVDGRPYLYFPTWESHQRIRQKISKFPEPGSSAADRGEARQPAAVCGEVPQHAATCGELRPESESRTIESESRTEEDDARTREVGPGSPWYRFVQLYEQNIGMFPANGYALEEIKGDWDILGPDVMAEAIRATALAHPDRPETYLQTVCQNWIRAGVHTVEQAKAQRKRKGGAKHDGDQRDNAGSGAWSGIGSRI